MSNFSFSRLYFVELFSIFIKFEMSSANSLGLEESKIYCLGKDYISYVENELVQSHDLGNQWKCKTPLTFPQDST